MEILKTGIDGLVQWIPKTFSDQRGWFLETFKASALKPVIGDLTFSQDNVSFSKKNVIRGLHLQRGRSGQAKLVTVLLGKVLDVVVDLRTGSPTFGNSWQVELSGNLKNMLFVPEGFAHGFAALEDSIFLYKCSNEYDLASETGIVWNDKDLNINWRVTNPIVSDKDAVLPRFRDLLEKSLISR